MRSAFLLNSTPLRNSFGFALSFGPLPERISPFQLALRIQNHGLSSRALRGPFSWSRPFSITTASLRRAAASSVAEIGDGFLRRQIWSRTSSTALPAR